MMRILCDLDSVLVNLTDTWFGKYKEEYDHPEFTRDDVHGWDVAQWVKPECSNKIYRYLNEPDFFRNLDPVYGAVDFVKSVLDRGHDLVIVTAPTSNPNSAKDKLIWLEKHLPFLPKKSYIMTHRKYMVKGDMLIDDGPHNLTEYREAWPNTSLVTFNYSWNKHARHVVDLAVDVPCAESNTWEDILDFIDEH